MLKDIERLRCIQKEVVFDSEGASGAILEPVSGGFVVRLGKSQSIVRRRFGIAHEIGHTFFYNLNFDPPTKIFPRGCRGILGEKKEEDICNAFARELLMPRELVEQDVANANQRNLQMIVDLAEKYLVSPEVAARRLLLDLSVLQNSILLFRDPSLPRGKTVWWFYGCQLRRYLRKEERATFDRLKQGVQEEANAQSIQQIVACDKTVLIEHYQSLPSSRLMILVTYRRDERAAADPQVSSQVKPIAQ